MPHLYISEAGMWMRYEPVFSEPRMGPWKREPHLLLLAVWVLVAFCVFIAAEAVAFAIALSRKAERHDKSILSD